MISAAECVELASQYKTLSQALGTSVDRASVMQNIARSFTSLAGQLDRLGALTRNEKSIADREQRGHG